MTHREHVLAEPDMYIGSVNTQNKEIYIYDDSTETIIYKEILYSHGLFKIFDEIIINARD